MSALTLAKSEAPKFNAGDMITGKLTMSDGSKQTFCFLINSVDVERKRYSVDDGNGHIDGIVAWDDVKHFSR